mgnify:CR=1 FL=1
MTDHGPGGFNHGNHGISFEGNEWEKHWREGKDDFGFIKFFIETHKNDNCWECFILLLRFITLRWWKKW